MTTKTVGHTPGPWQIVRRNSDRQWAVVGRKMGVASCGDTEVGHSNARLIAAAPELLVFTKRITAWLESSAARAANQEQQNRGRFNSLANACGADAKNYRAMAKDGRIAITKAEGDA